jgi:hypothetical protein
MKKMYLLLVATILLYSTTYAKTPSEGGAFENFGASLKFGALYGVGVDFSTSLHPNLKARVGFNYLGYNAASIIDFSGDEELGKGDLKFVNANLLFDYYPMLNGIFYITAGAYFGANKINMEGIGFDPFSLNDYVIIPDANGYFEGTVKFGGAVKPYLGLGVGHTIPNSIVGVKFELGVVYQGKLKVESDYMNTSMKPNDVDDILKIPLLESKFWPSATLSLTFRIK